MTNRSKRYKEASQKIDRKKEYPIAEAIQIIKGTATTKFDSSVEVHISLGIDIKKAEQTVRGTVMIPHGLGKKRRIAAFVSPEKEKEAKDAGADIIGDESVIKEIKAKKKCAFDIAIAEPQVMKNLGSIAKILGQKGLMPNPKTDTITKDVKKTIEELNAGKAMFRSDDSGNIHQMIGKVSFDDQKLQENYSAFLDAIKKAKPETMKGSYIKQVYLASSMGPSVKVSV
ncbi:50S ribosomal protein L1 [Patescibacteria group bacterium]|nr:50S ribosomal protein L1 [Patescibacteria group bacterium]